ncbi:MAG: HIT family protein [Phycisphaerae bacterium]|nr:MAG: HIT family protein [Phycisphaerae bacterium]
MPCPFCEAPPGSETLVADLVECRVVLSPQQGCPGWCILILHEHVEHLDALPLNRQNAVFAEVARVARAIRGVFPTHGAGGGPVRINYECLGNQTPHVHWHVIPRHADDPDPRNAVWSWPAERLRGDAGPAARAALAQRIREALRTTDVR